MLAYLVVPGIDGVDLQAGRQQYSPQTIRVSVRHVTDPCIMRGYIWGWRHGPKGPRSTSNTPWTAA